MDWGVVKQWAPTAVAITIALTYIFWKTVVGKFRNTELRVSALWIFPIKSCAGIQVQQSTVNRLGFQYDRNWMIVSEKTKKFMTQRELPHMVLIRPEIDEANGKLLLHLPKNKHISLDLELDEKTEVWDVTLWKSTLKAKVYDPSLTTALTEHMGEPCRLVKIISTADHVRALNYTPEQAQAKELEHQAEIASAFPDEEPFLMASEESLFDLNRNILKNTPEARQETNTANPIAMLCFRPNIILSGGSAWQEDQWCGKHIGIGPCQFEVVAPCGRCLLPNVNPVEGKRRKNLEPRKTLDLYRPGKIPSLQGKPRVKEDGVYFGVHMRHLQVSSSNSNKIIVTVGDRVLKPKMN